MTTEKDYQRQFLRDEITLDEYEAWVGSVVHDGLEHLMEPKERQRSWDEFKREGLLAADWENPKQPKNGKRAQLMLTLSGLLLIAFGLLAKHTSPAFLLIGTCLLAGALVRAQEALPVAPKEPTLPRGTLPICVASPYAGVGGMPPPMPPGIGSVARPQKPSTKGGRLPRLVPPSDLDYEDIMGDEQLAMEQERQDRDKLLHAKYEWILGSMFVPGEGGVIHKWK